MKHDANGYKRGCRCTECREANRIRRAQQRASKNPPNHGTESGYFNYGCRCAPCKAAGAKANAAASQRNPRTNSPERMAKRNRSASEVQARTLEGADHRYQQWTGAEMELAMRDDISARQIAIMLGRTYHAVVNMRRKIRDEPKYRDAAGVSGHAEG